MKPKSITYPSTINDAHLELVRDWIEDRDGECIRVSHDGESTVLTVIPKVQNNPTSGQILSGHPRERGV